MRVIIMLRPSPGGEPNAMPLSLLMNSSLANIIRYGKYSPLNRVSQNSQI